MGLFGSKKTYVASTVQNLAGDELDRPQYLKNLVIGNIIAGSKEDMGDTIQRGYLKGPGIRLRNFYLWATREVDGVQNYAEVGIPEGQLESVDETDGIIVAGEIPVAAGETAVVEWIEIDIADYTWWAEQYMMENHPTLLNTDWTSDIDEITDAITITFADTSTETFAPVDFDRTELYLYATYYLTSEEVIPPDPPVKNWNGSYIWIYRIGSGNAVLDDLVTTEGQEDPTYFPYIPIRINNKFISDGTVEDPNTPEVDFYPEYYPEVYAKTKVAFRRSIGGDLDETIADIASVKNDDDESSLDDIDFCYAVFAVAINVLENDCRSYIYEYFDLLRTNQNSGDHEAWDEDMIAYNEANLDWHEWKEAQDDPLDPLYGTAEPVVPSYPVSASSRVRIESNGDLPDHFRMVLDWKSITEITGSGLASGSAHKGDFWFEQIGLPASYGGKIYTDDGPMTPDAIAVDTVRLYHQIDEDSWRALEIVGMVHRNYVYNGKYVEIGIRDGLNDGKESGFLVPLHYTSYRRSSLVRTTQMSTACCFLVFNSYQIVKTGLLGSLFFKILIVAIIVAIVVFAPELAPVVAQAATATAATLGLVGIAGLAAAAAINAIASMIIMSLLTRALTPLLGRTLAAIVATVAMMAAAQGFQNMSLPGKGFSINFSEFLKVENLMRLTEVSGQAYAQHINRKTQGIKTETRKMLEEYEQESRKLIEQQIEEFGLGGGVIDPLSLLDSTELFVEYADTFLTRTLMTGSDIARLSLDMISIFPELTLSSELPLT